MKAIQTGILKCFKFSLSEHVYEHDFEIHIPLIKLHYVTLPRSWQKNCASLTKADAFILNGKVKSRHSDSIILLISYASLDLRSILF